MDALPFDSPIWSKLPAVYGLADSIPKTLEMCLNDEDFSMWDSLYKDLCHQMTPSGVVWAVVPHFVLNLKQLTTNDLNCALNVIALNERFAPEDPPVEELREPYDRAIKNLRQTLIPLVRQKADQFKQQWKKLSSQVSAESERMALAVDLSACLGKKLAAEIIDSMLAYGQTHFLCPDCKEFLRAEVDEKTFIVTSVDGTAWEDGSDSLEISRTPQNSGEMLENGQTLIETAVEDLNDEQGLYALASLFAHDFEALKTAEKILSCAVTVTCPGCGRSLNLLEHFNSGE